MDKELLKEILSIPSKSGNELILVSFICEFLKKNNITYEVDNMFNIYCTKGNAEIYPCVLAQTNTFQNYIYNIDVRTEYKNNSNNVLKEAYKGYTRRGKPFPFSSDKSGVFACLTLLTELPVLKAAFFVSNRIFCYGSISADPIFFENVGYSVEYVEPHESLPSKFFLNNLFIDDNIKNSEFYQKVNSVLEEKTIQEYALYALFNVNKFRESFDFYGINLSIGYYNYKTANEYVVLEDVENGIKIGRKMIEKLGHEKYKNFKDKKMLFINW